jgi:hypothetical protein
MNNYQNNVVVVVVIIIIIIIIMAVGRQLLKIPAFQSIINIQSVAKNKIFYGICLPFEMKRVAMRPGWYSGCSVMIQNSK